MSKFPAVCVVAVLLSGCTTVAEVDLSEPACSALFESSLTSILEDQGEKPDIAQTLAHRTVRIHTSVELGPRPFLVASTSGSDYTFFVQKKGQRCLLRLYGRQRGFTRYTNNLTYIATRELPACACHE